MSGEMMTFPKTWEEYEKYWGFNDSDEVYTNNARLIPSFRVKQWLDHIKEAEPDKGLLELMAGDINGSEPIGWLTAEEVIRWIKLKKIREVEE